MHVPTAHGRTTRAGRGVLVAGLLLAVVGGCSSGSQAEGGPAAGGAGPTSVGPVPGSATDVRGTADAGAAGGSAPSGGGVPTGGVPTGGAAVGTPASTGPSAAGVPAPGGSSDRAPVALDGWALTLPVEGEGDAALTLPVARPRPPWLRRNADGSLTFWAPVDGATTRGSSYARTELRETLQPGDSSVNWSREDPARLDATVRVERLPATTRKIVVGQIHGYNGEKKEIGPLLLIYVVGGDVVVSLRETPTGDGQVRSTVARGLRLGTALSYTVDVRDAVVRVRVDGVERFRSPVTTAWTGVGLYFKAGVYLQADEGDGSDGGQVTFTALRVRH